MDSLEQRTKFTTGEVAVLKDSLWRLTKRVVSLENFIMKQFGYSVDSLDMDLNDLKNMKSVAPHKKYGQRGRVAASDGSDSEDDDSTYSPTGAKRKRTSKKYHRKATRSGRIPKMRESKQNDEDEELGFEDEAHFENVDVKNVSILDSCEVSMGEFGDANAEEVQVNTDFEDNCTIEAMTCPECSAQFSGKSFLQFHLKKAHPNLRVIIQPAKVKPAPPPKEISSQGSQTKEDDSARIFTPELARQFMKFRIRAGSDIKQLTINGYIFTRSKATGKFTYWRCIVERDCSATIIENTEMNTYKRGTLGWNEDGLSHISHAPDFRKVEHSLRKARVFEQGLEWDNKKKAAKIRTNPPKKRVAKGLNKVFKANEESPVLILSTTIPSTSASAATIPPIIPMQGVHEISAHTNNENVVVAGPSYGNMLYQDFRLCH